MKTALIYLNVVAPSDSQAPKPEYYWPWAMRFAFTYQTWGDNHPYPLIVVHCGGEPSELHKSLFRDIAADHVVYEGKGWDIGAHQYAAKLIDVDFLICAATPVYFWRHGFVQKMVEAREKYGEGLYGPMASYEHRPHIRNCCWAFDSLVFNRYPHVIDTREKTFQAESGDLSITAWYESQGLPRIMVAADGCYDQPDWRKPANIFRRGDQSNCLVWDRHVDLYRESGGERKKELEDWADGKNNQIR